MRYAQLLFAMVGVVAAGGVMDAARAQRLSPAVFTAAVHSGKFDCNALNVSRKTLHITVSILDQNGQPLAVSPPTPTAPGAETSNSFGDPTEAIDAYCKVEAVGTSDRNDLRVVLNVQRVTTFVDPGSQANIPVLVARSLPGY